MSRIYPLGFVGTNFVPFFSGGIYAYLQNGMTMFAPTGTKITATVISTDVVNNKITVSNVTGGTIQTGQYVIGIGIPPVVSASNGSFTKVTDVSGSTITLSADLKNDLTGFEIHFYTQTGTYSIEYQIELMAQSGVESLRFAISWSDFENSTRISAKATNAPGDALNTITVSNANGTIVPGMYVLEADKSNYTPGIPRLSSDSNWKLAKVQSVNGSIVTLNVNLTKNISNSTVYFYNSTLYGTYDFTNGGINDTLGPYNLDQIFYLASKNGIELMPRLQSNCLPWDVDYDNSYLSSAPFCSQDPESDDPIIGGVKIYATGLQGSKTLTINDVTRGHLIRIGMIVTGNGLSSNTVTKVVKGSNSYTLTLQNSLSSNFNGYVTGTILNWSTNNATNNAAGNKSNLQFETLSDLNIFSVHVARKGSTIPKNYDKFVRFTNAVINRYGNNGSFWNDSIWNGKTSISKSASGTVSSVKYGQQIVVTNVQDLVVGMTIESETSTSPSVPSTKTDGNNSYIPEKTRICAISKQPSGSGWILTLTKALNKNMPSGTTVTAKYPKITTWQMLNEFDLTGNQTMKAIVKNQSTTKQVQWSIPTGNNWPQRPRHPEQALSIDYTQSDITKRLNMTTKYFVFDYSYSWAPSAIQLVEKIKKDAHSIDTDAKIALGAIAGDSDGNTLNKNIPSNIGQIDNMSPFQLIFDPVAGNGKNKFDKFSINRYPSSGGVLSWKNLYVYIISNILSTLKTKYYPQNNINPSVLPNVILSEYGWSTDLTYTSSSLTPVSESDQSQIITNLFNSVSTGYSFIDFVNRANGWTFDYVMYYKWASNQTQPANGNEKWRGLYKYTTATTDDYGIINSLDPKIAAAPFASKSLSNEGRI